MESGEVAAASNGTAAAAGRSNEVIVIDSDGEGDSSSSSSVEFVVPEQQLPPPVESGPSNTTRTTGVASGNPKADDSDDDIEDLGTTNVMRLPHARHDCPEKIFIQDGLALKTSGSDDALMISLAANKASCSLCFCFCCDVLASECPTWAGEAMTASTCHCLASNKGVDGQMWTELRESIRTRASAAAADPGPLVEAPAPRHAGTAASSTAAAPVTKKCRCCQLEKGMTCYSSTQWGRGDTRRCRICINEEQRQQRQQQRMAKAARKAEHEARVKAHREAKRRLAEQEAQRKAERELAALQWTNREDCYSPPRRGGAPPYAGGGRGRRGNGGYGGYRDGGADYHPYPSYDWRNHREDGQGGGYGYSDTRGRKDSRGYY